MKVDNRDTKTVGWKFNEWELKGVPLRIEVGENEIKSGQLSISIRVDNSKLKVQRSELQLKIKSIIVEIQNNLFQKHQKFTLDNTNSVDSYDEFKKIMETTRGFIKALWCESPECETKIKEETKATTRILPLDAKEEKGVCIYCKNEARHRWLFAQAY